MISFVASAENRIKCRTYNCSGHVFKLRKRTLTNIQTCQYYI